MFQIRSEVGSDKVPTLYILDAIGDDGNGGGTTVQRVQGFLNKYRDAPTIKVMISSTGGYTHVGLAIYDQLTRFPGTVHTYGSGMVASAATIIFMAGSIRELSRNCQFMIHEAWTQATGRADDMRRSERQLEQANRTSADIYSRRSGQSVKVINQWMSEEKWFTPQEAKQFGFATVVSEGVAVLSSFDLSRFKNVPQALQRSPQNDLDIWRQRLGNKAVDAALAMVGADPKPKKPLSPVYQKALALLQAQKRQKPVQQQPEKPKALADVIRFSPSKSVEQKREDFKDSMLQAAKNEASGAIHPQTAADLHRQNDPSRKPASGANAPKSLADLIRIQNSH